MLRLEKKSLKPATLLVKLAVSCLRIAVALIGPCLYLPERDIDGTEDFLIVHHRHTHTPSLR